MSRHSSRFLADLAQLKAIASEIATPHSADVDQQSRFPLETIQALRQSGLLSAAVPEVLGGAGFGLLELAVLCSTLARSCGSSAMILAMHYIQLACIVRHGIDSPFFRNYLEVLAREQYLLASMTSESGTFGDIRTSICALEEQGDQFKLQKDATTGSYCEFADGILVTCRRTPVASPSDQIVVLVVRPDYELTQTTTWDAMGMRGTCSPGFKLNSRGAKAQVIPDAFADASASTIIPYSHVLWSCVWWGIAADAVSRAMTCMRAAARQRSTSSLTAASRIAEASAELQAMRYHWAALAREFDELSTGTASESSADLLSIGWALKMNNLKVDASTTAPRIVDQALKITGILGYKNDTKLSVGRHYRDVLSAALMISNERINAHSASMLLLLKDE
jgi:acyl-CoA dehydrogenase